MKKKRTNITPEIKRQIVVLYSDMQSYTAVAKHLNIAINTVKNVWLKKDTDTDLCKIVQSYAKVKKESNESLLEMLVGTQYAAITKNAMDLLTTANMEKEINTRGIKALITITGISYDKTMAYKRLLLDERKVELAERTLELKETELQARIDNPDAFATVTIINDADEVARITRERIELMEHESINLN